MINKNTFNRWKHTKNKNIQIAKEQHNSVHHLHHLKWTKKTYRYKYANNNNNKSNKIKTNISDVNKKERETNETRWIYLYIYCNLFQNETNIKFKLHLCVGKIPKLKCSKRSLFDSQYNIYNIYIYILYTEVCRKQKNFNAYII